ncbi:MAG: SAVED domain-containing protein [Thermoanaerobaculia bacterium]
MKNIAKTRLATGSTRARTRAATLSSAVRSVNPTREVKPLTRVLLAVRAGGRCEFDGHNKYLFRHSLTLTEGNFAQAAHIVAFSTQGPRGKVKALSRAHINDVNNLMLLCSECHKLIDDHPDRYTVSTLRAFKRRHEKRISELTAMHPEFKTTALVLKANIGGRPVAISLPQVQAAVAPRYVDSDEPCMIDLTALPDTGTEAFYASAVAAIDEKVTRLYADRVDGSRVSHVSVFALGPMPLLMHLGNRLSDKIDADLYQRHRQPESWTWRTKGDPAQYASRRLVEGSNPAKVALVLSLSGAIPLAAVSDQLSPEFSIYELTLDGATPNPNFLRRRDDLRRFEQTFQQLLRVIAKDHVGLTELHLFPAVPAPVAVASGRSLFHKVDPALVVYDFDKNLGGFRKTIRINDHD